MMRTMYGPPGVSDASKAIVGAVPMKRYGEAEEVAKVVLFLLGAESSYCTGSVVVVDGGMTACCTVTKQGAFVSPINSNKEFHSQDM